MSPTGVDLWRRTHSAKVSVQFRRFCFEQAAAWPCGLHSSSAENTDEACYRSMCVPAWFCLEIQFMGPNTTQQYEEQQIEFETTGRQSSERHSWSQWKMLMYIPSLDTSVLGNISFPCFLKVTSSWERGVLLKGLSPCCVTVGMKAVRVLDTQLCLCCPCCTRRACLQTSALVNHCSTVGFFLALAAFQGSAEKIPDIFSAKTVWDRTALANWFWCAHSLLHFSLQIPNFLGSL